MVNRLAAVAALVMAASPASAEEESSRRSTRSVSIDTRAVAEGKTLFGQCAACHGEKGEGRVGIAPSLASKTFLEAASDDMLLRTIKKGRAGTTMIAWGGMLSDRQVRSIVAYMRHLMPTEPALLDESPNKGDVDRGARVFKDICRGCHGNSGAGYQETASGTGIGRRAFLDEVSDGYLRRIIRTGKSGTPMRAFSSKAATAVANLDAREIEDVITYLRAKAW